jgi:HK97 family phage portal protein
MGLLDGLRAMVEPMPVVVERTTPEYDGFVEALYDVIEARQQGFTLADALKLPPVIRGRALIAGVGASMLPLLYVDGQAVERQPRIVRKPDPYGTRYTFVHQTLDAMVADRYGEAFWLLQDHDEREHPRSARVLPNDEVHVRWDERRFMPRYTWRGRELVHGRDIMHIAPNRTPGELHGRGPINEALDYLYPIHEAEAFASAFFSSGGVPLYVLKTAAQLDGEEAARLKAQWVAARSTTAEPAVLDAGTDLQTPNVDAQKAQLTEARGAGAAVVARILGIPAALLHVETSGATITYTNPAGALEELVKSTIVPLYLTPLEQAWSELVPSTAAVRFELADLQRTDIAARFAVYATGIDKGVMTPEEARAYEGWAPLNRETSHLYDPEPAAEGMTV